MRRLMFPAVLALIVASGCAGTTSGGYYASASYSTPDLVYVSPGVQVIADYDEPIFYSDGFYWRYYGNTWYRSPYYNRGWIYARPPSAILRIDRPYAYRHYRPSGYVSRRYDNRRYDNRGYRRPAPVVRDHRDYRSAPRTTPAPVYRNQRAPVYRDQRYAPQSRSEARQRADRDRARDARERARRQRDRDRR